MRRCLVHAPWALLFLAAPALAEDEYPTVDGELDDAPTVPTGYHRESRIRGDLLLSGATTFGLAYLSTTLSSIALVSGCSTIPVQGRYTCGWSQSTAQGLLFIPVAGPFIGLGYGNTMATQIFLVLEGVSQSVGLGMMLASLLWRRSILVRDEPHAAATYVGPMSVGSGSGFGVFRTW